MTNNFLSTFPLRVLVLIFRDIRRKVDEMALKFINYILLLLLFFFVCGDISFVILTEGILKCLDYSDNELFLY